MNSKFVTFTLLMVAISLVSIGMVDAKKNEDIIILGNGGGFPNIIKSGKKHSSIIWGRKRRSVDEVLKPVEPQANEYQVYRLVEQQ